MNQTSHKSDASMLKRFCVTALYMGAMVGMLMATAFLTTSNECHVHNSCTKVDQIIFAVTGLFGFVFGIILLFVGLKGLLPGATKSKFCTKL